MRQIILDTETTGLDPAQGHRIIEVAAVEMINRRLTGNHLHYYINPGREIDAGAQKVHGITEEFLQDKPKFQDIADALYAYLQGSELIIHNAPFDLGFLDHEFLQLNKFNQSAEKKYSKISDCCSVIDTLVMARKKHRGQKNNLDALCKRYQVDNSGRDWHGALIDVELLGGVYLAMTGGQISLFDAAASPEAEVTATTHTNTQSVLSYETPSFDGPFKILYATEEELAAHEKYMEKLS